MLCAKLYFLIKTIPIKVKIIQNIKSFLNEKNNKIYLINEIKIIKSSLFLNYKLKEEKKYLHMHKFLIIDSLSQPCCEIVENFKKVKFKCKNYEKFNKKIIMLTIEKNITAKQIIFPQTLNIININKEICRIRSNSIKLKAILELKI